MGMAEAYIEEPNWHKRTVQEQCEEIHRQKVYISNLEIANLHLRGVIDSSPDWRQRAETAEKRVKELEERNADLVLNLLDVTTERDCAQMRLKGNKS